MVICIESLSTCLLVIKRKNVVQLHVDTADKYKIGPSFPTVTSTKDTLYVGGIPGECCIILCMSIKYDKNTSICQRVARTMKIPSPVPSFPAAEVSPQQTLPVTSSFVGCIQDMRINDEPISFERLSPAFGPVNLKECPGWTRAPLATSSLIKPWDHIRRQPCAICYQWPGMCCVWGCIYGEECVSVCQWLYV